eukprot:tig00000254_g22459.t1
MADEEVYYDAIVQFLRSPRWSVPIMQFIDDHCVVFDMDDENKLVYTEIHKNFIELVDSLLENYLYELGINAEQFVEVVVKSKSKEISGLVFNQILSVEDFISFKKMMAKRNMELELEVLRQLKGAGPADAAQGEPADDDERQLREALRLSKETFAQEMQGQMLARDKKFQALTDTDMGHALSISEAELEELRILAEQAELAHALAISASLEEERQRLLREEEEEHALLQKAREMSLKGHGAGPSGSAAPAAAPAAAAPKQPAPAPAAAPAAPAPAPAPAAAPFMPKPEAAPVRPPAAAPAAGPSGAAAAAPAEAGPSKELLANAEEQKRADLERLMMIKRQQELAKKQQEIEEAKKKEGQVDEVDMRRREEYLRKLRDQLKEKKKAEREQALKQYNDSAPAPPPPPPAAAAPPAAKAGSSADAEEEAKKLAMRQALIRRFKQDVLEQEVTRRGAH